MEAHAQASDRQQGSRRPARHECQRLFALVSLAVIGSIACITMMPDPALAMRTTHIVWPPTPHLTVLMPLVTPDPNQQHPLGAKPTPVPTKKPVSYPAPSYPVVHPTVVPTTVPTAIPTIVPTATLTTEAQTPLKLSDPNADMAIGNNTPWWQSLLDIIWKLGLVIGLIYLAMRGLAAFKKTGFATKQAATAKKTEKPTANTNTGVALQNHFFEPLEEIRLSTQHSLHAVRAGNRVILLARSGATLNPLSEIDLGDLDMQALDAPGHEEMQQQLMRSWTGFLPSSSQLVPIETNEDIPVSNTPTMVIDSSPPAEVIDAQWITVEADCIEAPPMADVLPMSPKQGRARASDRPAPPKQFDEETKREILLYAEVHGINAAAERYEITRQRITSLRTRYERERTERLRHHSKAHSISIKSSKAQTRRAPRQLAPKPEVPDHPRTKTPSIPRSASRASLINGAYGRQQPVAAHGLTGSMTPTRPRALSDLEPDITAAAIAKSLAERFGIKVPHLT